MCAGAVYPSVRFRWVVLIFSTIVAIG